MVVFVFEILRYEFFQNALYAGILLGVLLPLVGVFVVLRKMSYVTDALSHVSLAGFTFYSYCLYIGILPLFLQEHVPLLIPLLVTFIFAFLMNYLRYTFNRIEEIAIPIIHSISIACAIIFISLAAGSNTSIMNYLFGNINAVTRTEIYQLILFLLAFLIYGKMFYRKLLSASLDSTHARLQGIAVKRVEYGYILILAITITLSVKIIGSLLVSSLVILPVASALKISKSMKQTMIYALIFSEISIVFGIFIAFYVGLPTSAMIVLVSSSILLLTLCIARFRNI